MEWKRVKTIMIAVLLTTCLMLGFNIIRQVSERSAREVQAVRNACEVAKRAGVNIDPDMVLELPKQSAAMAAGRSAESQQRLADALLGTGCAPEEPGGGVSIYSCTTGHISIRRGGAIEIRLTDGNENMDREAWSKLLESAGLDLSDAQISTEGNTTVFTQYSADHREILNGRLHCRASGTEQLITGRWLLEDPVPTGKETRTRGELTLALAEVMQERGAKEVRSLKSAYVLQSENVRRLELIPVWAAETDIGTLLIDAVTKKNITIF